MNETYLDLIYEYGNSNQHIELINLLKEIWHWPNRIKYENGKLELSTGGWSENERIIEELSETVFWQLFWQKSERGGYYYFTVWNGDKLQGNFEDDFDQVKP